MAINKRLISYPTAAGDTPAAAIKPSENFETVLYTGNGGTQSITGGWIGKGGKFNGSSSKVTIPELDNVSAISCWVNPNDDSGIHALFGHSTDTSSYFYFYNTGQSSGQMRFGSASFTTPSYTIDEDTWTHLVITEDGSDVKVYVNKNLAVTFSSISFGDINEIGARTAGTDQYLNGKLDQVRFFDKELSSSEINTLHGENSSPVDPDIVSGCIALYEFEDNVKDTANNGKYGKAAHFNGSNGSLDIESSDLIQNNTESFSFWFKDKFVFGFYDPSAASSSDRRRWFIDNGTAGSIKIQVNNDQYNYEETGITTLDGNWHHLVATSGGKLYIDGTALTDFSTSYWVTDGTNGTSRDTIRMGTSDFIGSASQSYSEGQMDDLKIFDTALSADEVSALYANDTADSDFPDDPVAHYKFDGNALDETGDYDGTASNVVYGYDGTNTSNLPTYSSALGFTPDLVWIKARTDSRSHNLIDSVRGAGEFLFSNGTNEESTLSTFNSFDDNGFTVSGSDNYINNSSHDYVAWCWKAGGTAVSNTDGSITSSVSANTDAGFSIVTYTGAAGVDTVGHGLSQQPELMFLKNRSRNVVGGAYHTDINEVGYIFASSSVGAEAFGSSRNDFFNNNTPPTSDVFTVRSYDGAGNDTQDYIGNYSGDNYVAYLFHSVDSYQKVGSYSGNDGVNHIEVGFAPAFIMLKPSSVADNWLIYDNKRGDDIALFANLNNQDTTYAGRLSFTSDGFVIDSDNDGWNGDSETYIYLAIAADPDTTTPVKPKSFDVTTYSGNGSTKSIDTRFKPDLIWVKNRTVAVNHYLYDSIRGTGAAKALHSNTTDSESSASTYSVNGGVQSIDSNGFTVFEGTDATYQGTNKSGNNYVAWCWKAGDHDDNLPEINTEGDIDSTVSVNDAAGFSIVKYTGSGTSGDAVGHGLSQAPEMVIIKKLTGTADNWYVYHKDITVGNYLSLDQNIKETDFPLFNDDTPDATTFPLGSNAGVNGDGIEYIAYCWYSVSGYSKIGTYTGSGSSGKQVTNLGFKPDFLLFKNSSSNSTNWFIYDSERGSTEYLRPDLNNQKGTDGNVVFDDDGFTINVTYTDHNKLNDTYIYMAFKIN